MPQPDLFCYYLDEPASLVWCVFGSTGFLSHKESNLNCAVLFTNVSTTLHQHTCLSSVSRFPLKRVILSYVLPAAGDLLIPPTRTVTIGGRGFSVAGPVAWNSLPTDLKDGTLTFPVFKKLLKTHLFVTIWTAALRLCGDCMKGALQVPVSIQFNSIQTSTRFVGKPEGFSNVFFTYFDYFFGGQYKLGWLRGTRWGFKPPTSRQIKNWFKRNLKTFYFALCRSLATFPASDLAMDLFRLSIDWNSKSLNWFIAHTNLYIIYNLLLLLL